MNVFALKVIAADDATHINWRNVKYLADFYWKATTSMVNAGDFNVEHFPHTIHAVVADPDQIS